MADLGQLWFSLGIKDNTQAGIEEAMKRFDKLNAKLKLGIDKNVFKSAITSYLKGQEFKARITPTLPKNTGKLSMEVNKQTLRGSVNEALKGKEFEARVKMVVEKASVQDAIRQAFSKAGLNYNTTASDVRQQRIMEIQARMSQRAALSQIQLAAAHSRAQRAADLQAASSERLNRSMKSGTNISSQLRNQIANLYSLYTIERFVTQIVEIGGEFQKQLIALKSILGDAGRAETIFGKIRDLAVESPYTFKDLTGYTKQLAAFSIPYEELYDTTNRLADISSGLGVDMGRLILAYGQVRSAAFLRGQEVRQFTEAGIPLLDELAKKFSMLEGRVVSVGEVFDKISRREVPFQMVKDVLWDMTNAGGKFYNMQAVLTESLSGKLDKLKDSYEIMLADIAQANNGIIGGSLDMLAGLTGHWKELAGAIGELIVIYGSYKAAIMAVTTYRKLGMTVLRQAVAEKALATSANIALSNSEALAAARTKLLTLAKTRLIGVLKSLWAVTAANPYFWVAAGVSSLVYAIYKLSTAATVAEAANENFNRSMERIGQTIDNRKNKINELLNVIRSADSSSLQKQMAFDELSVLAPSLTATYDSLKKLEEADLTNVNRQVSELADANRASLLKRQAEEIKEYMSILSEPDKHGPAGARYAISGLKGLGMQGEIGWDVFDWAEAAQEQLNRITSELWKIEDAKRRASVPTEMDVRIAESSYRNIKEQFDYLSDFAAAMKKEVEGTMSLHVDGTHAERDTEAIIGEVEKKLGQMNGIPLSVEQQKVKDGLQETLEYMRRWKETGATSGVFSIPLFFDLKLNELEDDTGKAKKEFDYLTGKWKDANKESGTFAENRMKAIQKWRDAEKKYNEAKNSKNITNEDGSIIKGYKEQQERLKELKNEIESAKKEAESFGVDTGKPARTDKDPMADLWNERIRLIEKAISYYKEWSEIEGKVNASERTQSNPLFSSVKSYLSPGMENPEKIWEQIREELGNSKGQRKLFVDLGFKIEDLRQGEEKKELDRNLKEIEKYISETTKKWDLFKDLSDTTGNRSLAGQIVFGGLMESENLGDELKKKIEEKLSGTTFSFEDVLGMDEKGLEDNGLKALGGLVSAYRENSEKLKEEQVKNLSELIKNHKDYAAKIEEIESDLQKDLKDIDGRRAELETGGVDVESLISSRKKKAEEDKSSVLLEQFKKESDWANIFDDLGRMSTRTIDDMIERINAFSRSQELSVEETKELIEAMRKLREESLERNPWKGISNSAKELAKWKELQHYLGNAEELSFYDKESGKTVKYTRAQIENGIVASQEDMVKSIDHVIDGLESMNDAVSSVSGMFESLGMKGASDITDIMGNVFSSSNSMGGSFQSIGKLFGVSDAGILKNLGFVGMGIGAVTGIIGGIAKLHDKKLDEEIQKSQRRVEELQTAYDQLGKAVERSFGAATDAAERALSSYGKLAEQVERAGSGLSAAYSMPYDVLKDGGRSMMNDLLPKSKMEKFIWNGGKAHGFAASLNFTVGIEKEAYGALKAVGAGEKGSEDNVYMAQYASLVGQRLELQKQLNAEEGKKDSDPAKIQDYQEQIAELNDQITYFVQDTVASLYELDLQDWSKQLSDSLVGAFRNGEDAVEAFEQTASDLLSKVANNILRIGILEPAMKKLQKALFGEMDDNGNFQGGIINLNDLNGTMDEGMKYLSDWFNTEGKNIVEVMENAFQLLNEKSGGLLSKTESGGSMRSSIQGVTEDTANLLGSYINAMRADLSAQRSVIEKYCGEQFPKMTNLAEAQVQQLKVIADNTGEQARIASEIRDMLRSAKQSKSSGFWIH
ncbi:tape measure protein [Paraprevotella xylaniphila]|jgi:hypothetical protein